MRWSEVKKIVVVSAGLMQLFPIDAAFAVDISLCFRIDERVKEINQEAEMKGIRLKDKEKEILINCGNVAAVASLLNPDAYSSRVHACFMLSCAIEPFSSSCSQKADVIRRLTELDYQKSKLSCP